MLRRAAQRFGGSGRVSVGLMGGGTPLPGRCCTSCWGRVVGMLPAALTPQSEAPWGQLFGHGAENPGTIKIRRWATLMFSVYGWQVCGAGTLFGRAWFYSIWGGGLRF